MQQHIQLRAIEPEDLEFLYALENDLELWQFSEHQRPLSKKLLTRFIENAHLDPYKIGQLRLMVVSENTRLGMVDLYEFSPRNKRAFVGIVIQSNYRNHGVATTALGLISDYAKQWLECYQLAAHVSASNQSSISLFEKSGFIRTGVLTHWISNGTGFEDQYIYQKVL